MTKCWGHGRCSVVNFWILSKEPHFWKYFEFYPDVNHIWSNYGAINLSQNELQRFYVLRLQLQKLLFCLFFSIVSSWKERQHMLFHLQLSEVILKTLFESKLWAEAAHLKLDVLPLPLPLPPCSSRSFLWSAASPLALSFLFPTAVLLFGLF